MTLIQIKTWWLHFRFRHIMLELLISVCLACLVWLYTHNRTRNSMEHVSVPVQVQLASHQQNDYAIDLADPLVVTASFSGPQSRMREVRRKLQRGLLKATATLTIPASKTMEATFREIVRIDEDSIALPAGVKVEVAEENIPITVQRISERTLPVRLDYTGDARVSHIKIEPSSVSVRGPKATLDRASAIATRPYAVQLNADLLAAGDQNVRDQVALVSELEGRPIQTNPGTVQFRCRAVPKQKVHELAEVPIHFLCPRECPWKPRFVNDRDSKINLKLIGPVTEQQVPVLAFVDLTTGNLARGRNLVTLRLQLPQEFQLVEPATPLVEFYLEELERPVAAGQK